MLTRLYESVTNALDLNVATLSGCIDIIVIPQEDGTLRSTPFHVRFGKTKLLRSREKEVSVFVNDESTSLKMKLGGAGEAYFVTSDIEEEEVFYVDQSYSRLPDENIPLMEGAPADDVNQHSKKEEGSSPHQPTARAEAPIISTKITHASPSSQPIMHAEEYRLSEVETSPIEFSLCGHLLSGGRHDETMDNDVFVANKMTWEELNKDPLFWYHPSLVCRFDYQPPYYPGKVALPLVACWVAFNRPLSLAAVKSLLETKVAATPIQDQSLMRWMFGSGEEQSLEGRESRNLKESLTKYDESLISECCVKIEKRVLRPTSDQLKSLRLNPGCNKVAFTVSSSLRGTQTVTGSIYLWGRNSKIIISDVDGTITKSDVLGQLFPAIGRDWSHAGVASLFSKIKKANYKFVYLTARAIGQADPTRDYLFGLRQEQAAQLPDGPLIMSPDRLFSSFKREVIDRKPYVFKIAALKDIRNLFPRDYNPFYAGFGNRDTDHRSYVHIGCPESRVFIIDTKGKIHHINNTYASTYRDMDEIVEQMFPPVPGERDKIEEHVELAEDEQVRLRKRVDPGRYYESWAAEVANRALMLEGGDEVRQRSGLFTCCQVHASVPYLPESIGTPTPLDSDDVYDYNDVPSIPRSLSRNSVTNTFQIQQEYQCINRPMDRCYNHYYTTRKDEAVYSGPLGCAHKQAWFKLNE